MKLDRRQSPTRSAHSRIWFLPEEKPGGHGALAVNPTITAFFAAVWSLQNPYLRPALIFAHLRLIPATIAALPSGLSRCFLRFRTGGSLTTPFSLRRRSRCASAILRLAAAENLRVRGGANGTGAAAPSSSRICSNCASRLSICSLIAIAERN